MHDLTAELKGYRDELAGVQPDTERADLIRRQMNGVRAAIKDKADQLDEQADNQQAIGQDVPAAEARIEARRYRDALEEHDGEVDGGEPDDEAAESAVPDGAGLPSGTADDVLTWVGDDRERAAAALAVEEGRDHPRSTLASKLRKLVDA